MTSRGHRTEDAAILECARIIAHDITTVTREAACTAIKRAAGSARARRELHRVLLAHTDALSSGSPDVPPALVRLARILAEQGHAQVRVPECLHCGDHDRALPARVRGGRLCWSCNQKRTAAPCSQCARIAPVMARGSTGPLCGRCHQKPRRRCGQCGSVARVSRRATADVPDLCSDCTRYRITECVECGHTKRCRRSTGGTLRCAACTTRSATRIRCSRCQRHRRIAASWPIGVICPACYEQIRANPAPCTTCGRRRALIGTDTAGNRICGPCAGTNTTYECVHCGQCRPYQGGRYARIVLRERLDALRVRADPSSSPVVAILAAADNPRAVIRWLNGPTGKVFTALVISGTPVDHTTLDALTPGPIVGYLRSLLIHAAVLDDRFDYLERVVAWLDPLLAGQPAHISAIIRPYAIWDVLVRARRHATRREPTSATCQYLRQKIGVALDFLTWLSARGRTLDLLNQHDIDLYLAAGATTGYRIRGFITWLRARSLTHTLTVPRPPQRNTVSSIAHDERWEHLERCLHDEQLPLPIRAAGALLLLYGNRVTHTVTLTTNDLHERNGQHFIVLNRHPVLLPPPLAELLWRLRDHSAPVSTLSRAIDAPAWLFPGRYPGTHRNGPAFTAALAAHGIHVREARSAALLALAEQLPATILADLLQMHPHTATRWITLAKRDWNPYIAERAENQNIRRGK